MKYGIKESKVSEETKKKVGETIICSRPLIMDLKNLIQKLNPTPQKRE